METGSYTDQFTGFVSSVLTGTNLNFNMEQFYSASCIELVQTGCIEWCRPVFSFMGMTIDYINIYSTCHAQQNFIPSYLFAAILETYKQRDLLLRIFCLLGSVRNPKTFLYQELLFVNGLVIILFFSIKLFEEARCYLCTKSWMF